jgi:hypothetical protein
MFSAVTPPASVEVESSPQLHILQLHSAAAGRCSMHMSTNPQHRVLSTPYDNHSMPAALFLGLSSSCAGPKAQRILCCCPAAPVLAALPAAAAMQNLGAHHLSLPSSWWPTGRFTNPWPTWTGDKTPRDVLAFFFEMQRVGAPNWGYLSTNKKPTLEEMG